MLISELVYGIKLNVILVWLSGFLFAAGAWQLEIVHLRRERDETYSLPFYIKNSRRYSFWGDVWMAVIVLAYLILFVSVLLD
jgi:hypothetical protein